MPPDDALAPTTIAEVLEEFGLDSGGFVSESAEGVLTRFDDDESAADDDSIEAEFAVPN